MNPYEDYPGCEAAPMTLGMQRAYGLAIFSTMVLLVYLPAQVILCLCLQHNMKLLVEPYLLLLGVVLHVQWRRVAHLFRDEACPRPVWIGTADCLSFVTTFWAFFVLVEAVLREAKII